MVAVLRSFVFLKKVQVISIDRKGVGKGEKRYIFFSIMPSEHLNYVVAVQSTSYYILGDAAGKDAVHLIETLLKFNPNQRLTAHSSLKHPYVARFHNAAQVNLKVLLRCNPSFRMLLISLVYSYRIVF